MPGHLLVQKKKKREKSLTNTGLFWPAARQLVLCVFVGVFMQIGSRSSVYSPETTVRKTGSYIYEEFMPTDGTDVKVGR